jgi:DNA-binding transcriptional ArsR family regulator
MTLNPFASTLGMGMSPWQPEAPQEPLRMATATASNARTSKDKAKNDDAQRLKRAQRAALLLKQASDATRLQILGILADGERHVGGLCDELGQSQPAVSHHLALLRHGSVVTVRRQGKNNFYALAATGEELAKVIKDLMS